MDLSTRQGRREQGQLIQKAVERAGLSVEDLANRIGCSRALIYQYLSGTTLAQPDRLQQIAAVTGLPLTYFFGAADEPQRKGRKTQDDPQIRISERIQQWEELARAQEGPPDWASLAATCERIASLAAQVDDHAAEARALSRLGKACIRRGEFSRAVESLLRSTELFAKLGDAAGENDSRQALGNALLATGRVPEAQAEFERVAAGARWQERWMGAVSLAAVHDQLGDYRRAMNYCDEAAAILEDEPLSPEANKGQLYVNANRVNIYLACGDYQSAEPLAVKCLEDAESFGLSDQHLEARLSLGLVCTARGDWARAHRMLSTAVQLSRFVGDKSREAMALGLLASLLAALGDFDSANELAKDALASALSHGDRRTELFAHGALADSYMGSVRINEARYHANQALAVTTTLRHRLFESEARLRLARLAIRTQEYSEASEHARRAVELADKLGARHVLLDATIQQFRIAHKTGELTNAPDLDNLLEQARELGLVPLQWQTAFAGALALWSEESQQAEAALACAKQGVDLLQSMRSSLTEAGIADTLLEDAERLEAYALYARMLGSCGRSQELQAFIEAAGWPPLNRSLEKDRPS